MPPAKPFYIFVEGATDQTLIERKVLPAVGLRRPVRFIQYRNLANKELRKYIRAATQSGGGYAFLRDQDEFDCHLSVISRLLRTFRQLERARIHVVVRCGDGWHFGGLSRLDCIGLGLNHAAIITGTSLIRSSTMEAAVPTSCDLTKAELLAACLDRFDLELAKQRNPSLRRFCRKLRDEA